MRLAGPAVAPAAQPIALALRELIAEHGPEAVTVEMVIRRAGLPEAGSAPAALAESIEAAWEEMSGLYRLIALGAERIDRDPRPREPDYDLRRHAEGIAADVAAALETAARRASAARLAEVLPLLACLAVPAAAPRHLERG